MTAPSINAPTPPYLQDTPIHDFFSQDNILGPIEGDKYGTSLFPEQYEEIAPALRLASKLITNTACLPWWTTLCLSKVEVDSTTQRRYLPRVEPTPLNRDQVRQRLNQVARRVRIRFTKPFVVDAYAATDLVDDMLVIKIHQDSLHYIQKGLPTDNESRRLCFYFQLATTLVHEAAHCVFRTVHGEHQRPEPYHGLREPESEMGSSWENFICMGKVQPLNGLRSAAKGIVWWRWEDPQRHYNEDILREPRFWGVYMAWIEALFQELTWRKVDRLGLKEIEMRTCGDRARWGYDEEGYWREKNRIWGILIP